MKIPYTYVLLIKTNLKSFMFIDANRLLGVLYQALSQCDLSGPCSTFHSHLFKANQAFPFQAQFVFFSDPSSRAYPLVRSFKASL
jgi:hypothetical protein